jgi:hypothetical protein
MGRDGRKQTLVAKATNHSAGFIAGDESPALGPYEFFRGL